MEDKLITIATFPNTNDSDVLESLFQNEGIDYTLSHGFQVIPGADIGLLVKEEDVTRSVDLIKKSGFDSFLSSDII